MPERCEHPRCYTHAVRLVIRGTIAKLLCLQHTPHTRCNRCGVSFVADGHTQHRCAACEYVVDSMSHEPDHKVILPKRSD